MERYAIWNKVDPVITPSGEVFTAEQWMDRYPVARLSNISIVCAKGEINGAFFGTVGQMKQHYEGQGVNFNSAVTDQDIIDIINNSIEENEAKATQSSGESTPEERIAAALEFQNMLALPTVNDDDPDNE